MNSKESFVCNTKRKRIAKYFSSLPELLLKAKRQKSPQLDTEGSVYMEVGEPQIGEVTCGGSPLLTSKRDQILYGQTGYPTKAGYMTYLRYPTCT